MNKVLGLGTDIVPTSDFRTSSRNILTRNFTDKEIEYCSNKRYPHLHFAARWAAKEAFIKAQSLSLSIGLKNIEVYHDTLGTPHLKFYGKELEAYNDYDIFVSVSHTTEYATATVIIGLSLVKHGE